MSEVKKKKHIGLIIALVVLAVIVVVAVGISVGLSKTFLMKHPELDGEPEVGKWYRITPETAKSSNGTEWHGMQVWAVTKLQTSITIQAIKR